MKAKLFSNDGTVKGDVDLPAAVFEAEINEPVIHQVVTMLQANQRQGTSKTKTRAEVSGGGRKPWKQKGTGNARAGSNTSPIWVRGGKAHGPKPRDYWRHIPSSIRKIALRSMLSSRAKDEKIMVIDAIACETPKTKTIVQLLKNLSVSNKRNLLLIDTADKNVFLSGRNIANLHIKHAKELNAYDVLANENIIFGNQDLIKQVEKVAASE